MTDIDLDIVGLHTLPSGQNKKPRKRVGRGHGSGHGKTSGRGHKGAGARSGSKQRVRFEGGQTPLHMRMRKLRGPNMKKSMPIEPFRTETRAVGIDRLTTFFPAGGEVAFEDLVKAGLCKQGDRVKILANGTTDKAYNIHAHGISGRAREIIEAAGGSCTLVQ